MAFSRTIRFCEIANTLCIETTYPNQLPFLFFPIGGDKLEALYQLKKYYQTQNYPFCFHSLSENAKNELETLMPQQFVFELNRDRSDYIYEISALIELKGRKFHKKKTIPTSFMKIIPIIAMKPSQKITNKNYLILGIGGLPRLLLPKV